MNRRILLIGKNGQIGSELAHLLPPLGEVIALDRQQLDLCHTDQIRDTVQSIRPRVIVNAAAYTAVDQAESDEPMAQAINATAPRILGEEASKTNALLVHYSTDYVFEGTKSTPYVEEDPPNPLGVYGRTKLLGERGIQESGASHLIFRTGWVYSQSGRNFLLTILRLATQKEELKIVADQVGAPTWSHEIALATVGVLSRMDAKIGNPIGDEDYGIYHLTAAGQTNWRDFAKAILEKASQRPPSEPWFAKATSQLPFVTQHIRPISTSEYPTPARRPMYSVLSNARLARVFGIRLPDWQEQLNSCFAPDS